MYLIEIDIETGLIKETAPNSGWKAIKSFNDLFKKKGIKALTVVALSIDYLSIFHHYSDKDRPIRAMEEIYGKRNALNWEDDIIQKAIESYKELQFNPDLEQERINMEIKMRLLSKISIANLEENDVDIEKYRKSLNNHEQTIEKFNARFDKKAAIEKSITQSGYELSRIENDIKSRKNSKFITHGEEFENPDKLGLNEYKF